MLGKSNLDSGELTTITEPVVSLVKILPRLVVCGLGVLPQGLNGKLNCVCVKDRNLEKGMPAFFHCPQRMENTLCKQKLGVGGGGKEGVLLSLEKIKWQS